MDQKEGVGIRITYLYGQINLYPQIAAQNRRERERVFVLETETERELSGAVPFYFHRC